MDGSWVHHAMLRTRSDEFVDKAYVASSYSDHEAVNMWGLRSMQIPKVVVVLLGLVDGGTSLDTFPGELPFLSGFRRVSGSSCVSAGTDRDESDRSTVKNFSAFSLAHVSSV